MATATKNTDVMFKIKDLLHDLKESDPGQYNIITTLLEEIYKEYNSGTNRNIERKLVDLIDAELNFKLKKSKNGN